VSLTSKGFGRQLGVLGSGIVVGLVIRFVQSALVARLLGVAEFGRLAAVVAVVAIISRVNDLGLPGSLSYYFRSRPGSLHSILAVIASNFVWCCLMALALALVAPSLPLPFAEDLRASPGLQLSFAIYLALSTPATILPGLLTASGDYGWYVRLTNLDALFQAVFTVGAIVLVGASYRYVVPALALEQGLAVIAYLWYVRRYRNRSPRVGLELKEAYAYGLRLQWGVIMKLISNRADLLIVGALLPVSQVGLYSVALGLRDLGLLPQSAYAAPFMNLVIDRSRDGAASDRIPVLTTLVLQITLSFVMVLAAAAALPLLIPGIYGAAFAPAVGPSIVLFASLIFLAPASLCWMTYNAKGRPHLTSVILTAGGVLGPLLTYTLVSNGYGLYGASTSGALVAAVTFALSIYFLVRLQDYRSSDYHQAIHRARSLAGEAWAYIGRLSNRTM
jgi:O-antigen/teichoic acid export membrane protein